MATDGLGVRCVGLGMEFEARNGRVRALEHVDLSVSAGEFVSIVGPSGCGKTTLLRAIAGLIEPSEGEVVWEPPGANADALAVVFQEPGLFPWMTVEENVAFGMWSRRLGRAARRERAHAFVDGIGLGAFARHYPGQLSRGMRQRVDLARAFAREPRLLLLDEPFASLDAQSRRVLQQELAARWAQSGMTVILVTHDIDEAILLADRVVLLSGSPAQVTEQIDVDLPRPRDPDAAESEDLRAVRRRLWSALTTETRRRLAMEESEHAAGAARPVDVGGGGDAC